MLSNSVAKALKLLSGPETQKTIEFVDKFDKLFDCLNVSSLSAGKHSRKAFKVNGMIYMYLILLYNNTCSIDMLYVHVHVHALLLFIHVVVIRRFSQLFGQMGGKC